MTSPSSQPIRSMSNQFMCTSLPVPPHGQVLSCCSLALQTACMFFAEASIDIASKATRVNRSDRVVRSRR